MVILTLITDKNTQTIELESKTELLDTLENIHLFKGVCWELSDSENAIKSESLLNIRKVIKKTDFFDLDFKNKIPYRLTLKGRKEVCNLNFFS